MPILKPELSEKVTAALESCGLAQKSSDKTVLTKQLEAAGLGLDVVLEQLSLIVRGGESEHLRLRAIEDVLKAHGALQPEADKSSGTSITFVFNNDASLDFAKPHGVAVLNQSEKLVS